MEQRRKKSATFFLVCLVAAEFLSDVTFSEELKGGATAMITVQPAAKIQGEEILLGDISLIEGNPLLVKQLEDIVIGQAPLPARSRKLKKSIILTRLKQNNINLKAINLQFPEEEAVVSSDYLEFLPNELEAMTRQFILSNMPWKKGQDLVEIKDFKAKPLILPKGKITYEFCSQKSEDFLGPFAPAIIFRVNGEIKAKVRVSADIHVVKPVVMAKHRLERHQIIEPEDLQIEQKEITRLSNKVIFNPEDIVSKRTRYAVDPDTIMKEDMLEVAPLIHRGDLVTIIAETDKIKITVPGQARQEGCKGEIIRVTNTTSKNEIYARIRNSKEVEVEL